MDKRLRDLVTSLIKKKDTHLQDIQENLHLTKRQLLYVFHKLNELLVEEGLPEVLVNEKRIEVNDEQYAFLVSLLSKGASFDNYIMDAQERLRFMYLMLVSYDFSYLSLFDFLDELRISKTTALADLKRLEKILEEKAIQFSYSRKEGYFLVGDELRIRQLLFEWIIEDFSSENHFIYDFYLAQFKEFQVSDFMDYYRQLNKAYQLQLVESRFTEFSYFIVLIIERMRKGNFENLVTDSLYLQEFREYDCMTELLEKLAIDNIKEANYLTAWMLGQSVGNLASPTKDRDNVKDLTEQLLENFQRFSGIQFIDKTKILSQLYSHLRPTYYRLYFHLPVNNNLSDKVKSQYRSLFYLVEKSLKSLAAFRKLQVPDKEIAFLTIHFAVALKVGQAESSFHPMRAVVVCGSGVGSSTMVYEELRGLFSEIIFNPPIAMEELFQLNPKDFDLVFTTTQHLSILTLDKPVFTVNTVMTAHEKYQLIREVYEKIGARNFCLPQLDQLMAIIEKYATIDKEVALRHELLQYLSHSPTSREVEVNPVSMHLSQILTVNRISLVQKVDSLELALEKVAAPLLQDSTITKSYYQQVLNNLKEGGQNYSIAQGILLPHANPIGVNQVGMSLLILKTPLKTQYGDISLIFFLAAVDNEKHISMMRDLLKLVSDASLIKQLQALDNPEAIQQLIASVEEF